MGRKQEKSLSVFDSKKGTYAWDLIFIMILFLVVVFGAIIGKSIVADLNIISDDLEITADSKAKIDSMDSGYVGFWDGVFLFMFVMLILGLWFTSYIVDTHPFFYVISIALMIAFTLITMLLSNVYEDVFTNSEFSDEAAQFTIIPFIMSNIVAIMIVVGFVSAGILYAKLRGGQT